MSRTVSSSGAYQSANPKRSTPWVPFPEHGGFYRLTKGEFQFCPADGNAPSLEEVCQVDLASLDHAEEMACRVILHILTVEPFCGRCELPGSRCGCAEGNFR